MRRALLAVLLLAGCATTPPQATRIDLETRTVYMTPRRVDAECFARLGGWDRHGDRVVWYGACYDGRDDVTILPHDPPAWLVEHERKHREEGWRH